MSEQGVAQRVIAELKAGIGKLHTQYEHIAAVRTSGARYLHDELSTEARRVLLENEDALEQARSSKDAAKHQRLVTRRLVLISTFQRLGLDLNEPEDSDE